MSDEVHAADTFVGKKLRQLSELLRLLKECKQNSSDVKSGSVSRRKHLQLHIFGLVFILKCFAWIRSATWWEEVEC